MAKPKLAIFINTLEVAGSEKVVALLINHFCETFDIHLILLNKIIQYELPLNKITVKAINGSSMLRNNKWLNLLKIPILSIRLKKYLQQQEIDTCLCVLNRPAFIGALLKRMGWKGRILVSIRTYTSWQYPAHTLAGKTGRWMIKKLLHRADLILPNSQGIAADLMQHYGIKNPCQVIYNPIDLPLHKTLMQRPVRDIQFDKFTFVHIGRFEEVKNHQLLLEAVQKLNAPAFQVLLIGYGPLEDEIRQSITQMNIQEKIVFLGYREAEHVASYIARSHCLVMTSLAEGFPNVLLEALASGVPIISTDCNSGPREILCKNCAPTAQCSGVELSDYGILVPVNDAASLAKAMLLMMEDEAMRLRYAAISAERAACFNLPDIMQQYQSVISPAG